MAYRLISYADFTVTSRDGVTTTSEKDVRAFPAPKRGPAGIIEVDGKVEEYTPTNGKGRGSEVSEVLYTTVKGESGYFYITPAEKRAIVGSPKISLTTKAKATSAEPTTPVETLSASELRAKAEKAARDFEALIAAAEKAEAERLAAEKAEAEKKSETEELRELVETLRASLAKATAEPVISTEPTPVIPTEPEPEPEPVALPLSRRAEKKARLAALRAEREAKAAE